MTAAYQTRPRPQVTAVVVTGGRSPYLPQALWCLARQTRPAETTLLVCTDQAAVAEVQEMALMCGLTAATLQVVAAPKAKNFGQAVAGGLATAGLDGAGLQGTAADAAGVDSFLWLLHDDCYPEPGALEALAAALELGPSVALAGPKQVRPEDPRLLEEVGCSTTPFGRRLANGDNGELDQGQYDANDDVLAVGTAGLLVRLAAWRHLGGLDPALGPYRDGLDLSRRARLAGYRVVVAPEAVMGHEKASYLGLRPTGRSGRRGACSGQHASGSTKAQARREPNPAASFAPRRRALIFTQLVHGPVWALPLVTVAAIASAIGRFFWRLATKDFRLAAAELAAPVAVLARPGRVFASRRLAARTARAARRSLRPLQLSAREARALRRDRRITAAEHLRLRQAPTEIEIAELRALAARRRRMFAALAVVVLAGTLVPLFRQVGPGFLTGGALGPLNSSAWQLALSVSGGWLSVGTGQAGPGDPFSLILAAFTALGFGHGNAGVMIMLIAAPLVGALGAWLAAGAAARSVWIRAWATLFWFASPALWTALAAGRLGAAVTHAALPWVIWAAARAIGANRLDVRPPVVGAVADAAPEVEGGAVADGDRAADPVKDGGTGGGLALAAEADRAAGAVVAEGTAADDIGGQTATPKTVTAPAPGAAPTGPAFGLGSVAAAAGAGLAFAIACAGTPMLLAPGSALLVLAGLLGRPGRRLRLLFAPVPALALFAPLIWHALQSGQWRELLADPGTALQWEPAPWYLQAVGWVTDPVLPGLVPASLTEIVAAGLSGLVAVAALAGLLRTGRPARAVRTGWLVALTGLGLIWLAGRLAVSFDGLTPVHPWAGGAASLVLAGLLMAATAGLSGLVGRAGARARAWRRTAAWIGVAALAAGPVGAIGLHGWQWLTRTGVETHRIATPAIAPIAAAGSSSDLATTTLVISATADGYTWDVVRGEGHELSEPQGLMGARLLQTGIGLWRAPGAADQSITAAVAGLAGRDPGDAARDLALAGIGFVSVPKAMSAPALEVALDAAPGFSRITETAGAVVWQIAPGDVEFAAGAIDQAARAHVVDPDGTATAVRLGAATKATAKLEAGPAGRQLVLAETADSGWRATLNGQALVRVAGDAPVQAFELPATGGTLKIWYEVNRWVPAGQIAIVLLTLVLALPFRRSPGPEEVEE